MVKWVKKQCANEEFPPLAHLLICLITHVRVKLLFFSHLPETAPDQYR